MFTATVRYKLPPHIDTTACRKHFHKIAPDFQPVKGLISKHFIDPTEPQIEALRSGPELDRSLSECDVRSIVPTERDFWIPSVASPDLLSGEGAL